MEDKVRKWEDLTDEERTRLALEYFDVCERELNSLLPDDMQIE